MPPSPPPSPPLAAGRIYANYTATVEEILQVGTITTSIDPVAFSERLENILNERIVLIADSANISYSSLQGVVSVYQPGYDAQIAVSTTALIRRRLTPATTPLDTSLCDENSVRIGIEILMETESPEARNTFMDNFDNTVLPGFIANVTGSNVHASTCAPSVVSAAGRETVDAPPPPPTLGLRTEPDDPLSPTVVLIAAIIGALALCVCGGYVAYIVLGRNGSDEKEKEKGGVESIPLRVPYTTTESNAEALAGKKYFVLSVGGVPESANLDL